MRGRLQLLVIRSCTGTLVGHKLLATWAVVHHQQVLHRLRRLCQLYRWCYGYRAVDWRSCRCNVIGCCYALCGGGHHGQRRRQRRRQRQRPRCAGVA